MIDVAASVGKDPLPESFGIGPDHLKEALDKQGVDIDPLDVVLVRTGTGGVWLDGSGVGANNSEVEAPRLGRDHGGGGQVARGGERSSGSR